LICIPGKQNTVRIQKSFEAALGAGRAMAFGRIKDLENACIAFPDAAVVAPDDFFHFLRGYTVVLIGKLGSIKGERFLIVSAQKNLTKADLTNKKVGMLDFLGKDRIYNFIKEQFGISLSVVQRVNKDQDLLTMLGIEAVDAIVVSESQYKDLLSNTKLPLKIVATSAKNVGLAVVALPEKQEPSTARKALLGLPQSVLLEIGITGWEGR